ncbi:MAG TPA: hypothetical protein VNT99_04070 [Methylomirabilota bacterium]|nr:hypothetical protein [Methylomirabilota bacterium]
MQTQLLGCNAVAAVVVTLSLVVGSGCGKSAGSISRITDSSKIVVEPGRGVPKVCELGMTFREIKRATGEATTHGLYDRSWSLKRLTQERYLLVPTLGVIGIPGEKGGWELLTFHVQPYDSSISSPGLVVNSPFRGSVANRLSFNNRSVSRKEVEAAFGTVTQGSTNSSQSLKHIDKTQPFFIRSENVETFYYTQLGLRFRLESDVVTSFGVWKPTKFE